MSSQAPKPFDVLVESGFNKPSAQALARYFSNPGEYNLKGIDLMQVGSGDLSTASEYFKGRGIAVGGGLTMRAMEGVLKWLKSGKRIQDLEDREEIITSKVSWKPFTHESTNQTFLGFLKSVQSHLCERGLESTRRDSLVSALERTRTNCANDSHIEDAIRDLPQVIHRKDLGRYVKMLERKDGDIVVQTKFPVRFGLFPSHSRGHYYLLLIPESDEMSRRLKNTRYPGDTWTEQSDIVIKETGKKNHFPGALGYAYYSVDTCNRLGVLRESQSDHDPRETRGFKIEDWSEKLRTAMEIDLTANGCVRSIIPKPSHILETCVPASHAYNPGMVGKIARAYGRADKVTDTEIKQGLIQAAQDIPEGLVGEHGKFGWDFIDQPPVGYTDWNQGNVSLRTGHYLLDLFDPQTTYWVKRLADK
jgi:hypothetical protein